MVNDVELTIVKLVPKVSPNLTNCAVVNPVPVTVTTVPPEIGLRLGLIPEIVGADTELSAAPVMLTVSVAEPTNTPLVAVTVNVSEVFRTTVFIAESFGSYEYAPVASFTVNVPKVPTFVVMPLADVPPVIP
jgi:hypothetical protein